MLYTTKRCRQCDEDFLTNAPEWSKICEPCEQENLNDMYQAQEIDWHQERNHV